ncbi:hypothetical protein FHS43_006367 [Streptosporangium becharense]|uniref:DUF6879 domain-containing protein n=1 Tax=Streptosporangium becharense TaxID=1816182 RepID=A0A7W9ICU6_9ACTN|nr:DUF6879 family protein [Streptosporangium becharense]MBB2915052.1 hypothetical protein [Streptosporangium becharense]MBB5818101.1 hypothetical protein [Streptosporangium becharense]
MSANPTLDELFQHCERSALHLEMRDGYGNSSPGFRAWREGVPFDRTDFDAPWVNLIRDTVERGVVVCRARIISEPVSDYIRYEHSATPYANLAGGEQVRWLPRQKASDLALPGNDFWLFDGRLVRFAFHSGDGEPAGYEVSEDPAVVKLCVTAFEGVWERGVDHAEYRPT